MGDDFVPGQRIGDYEVLGVLGAGGMGKVYKVRNVISDRVEAMKVLLANLAMQKELADRFLREIKLLASLSHPNIAALNTALTLDNQLVMMMEFVDGVTLASRLQQGPIPAADAVKYSDQVLSALSYAHKLNVIHRDVKPANMMLTPLGVVKLMDFGIARPNNDVGMTVTGTTLGSLNYMSPEQVRGEGVDQRSDLYSMGVSLYEMVTGQLPFRGHSNYSVMSAHLQEIPQPPIAVRPDLPKGLSDVILMAMAKDPKDRFQSAEAFSNALKSVMSGATVGIVSPIPGTVRVPPTAAPVYAAPAPVPVQATVPMPMVAAAAAQPAPAKGRGVYMALGALLAVIVLFAAGYYVPRMIKTQASPGATTVAQPVAQPADAPVDISAPPPDAVPASAAPAPAPAAPPREDPAIVAARLAAEKQAREEAERKAALLKEVELQEDQLEARSATISASLDNLRRAQQSQGYGLRGDIVQAEQMMQINMAHAQTAMHDGDPDKAKEYLDKAETQAQILERFQGR